MRAVKILLVAGLVVGVCGLGVQAADMVKSKPAVVQEVTQTPHTPSGPMAAWGDTCGDMGDFGLLMSTGGILSGDTTGMNNDYGDSGITDGSTSCDPAGWRSSGGSGEDIIAGFTVDTIGLWNFSNCPDTGTPGGTPPPGYGDFDSSIMILSGATCPGDTVTECDGDACGGPTWTSFFDVFLVPGVQYWLLVDAYAPGTGAFDIRYVGPCTSDPECIARNADTFCDGDETCDLVGGLCSSPGNPCGGSTPVCIEGERECIACYEHAEPDEICGEDYINCNGIERCDTETGSCYVITPCEPTQNCWEGTCETGGQYCNTSDDCDTFCGGDGIACEDNTVCDPGLCGGACYEVGGFGTYAPCMTDADCTFSLTGPYGAGLCLFGQAFLCLVDEHCPAGACTVTAEACHHDADCPPVGICLLEGTPCNVDGDCTVFPGDVCIGGQYCDGAEFCMVETCQADPGDPVFCHDTSDCYWYDPGYPDDDFCFEDEQCVGEACLPDPTYGPAGTYCVDADPCWIFGTNRGYGWFGPAQGWFQYGIGEIAAADVEFAAFPPGRNLVSYMVQIVCRESATTMPGPYDVTMYMWSADASGDPVAPIPGTTCHFEDITCGNGITGDPNRTTQYAIVCTPSEVVDLSGYTNPGVAPYNPPDDNHAGVDVWIGYTASIDSQGFAIAADNYPGQNDIRVGSSNIGFGTISPPNEYGVLTSAFNWFGLLGNDIHSYICVDVVGPCCIGPVCEMLTVADCDTAGGIYIGDSTATNPISCDDDADGDGVADYCDNCPADDNPGQEDCNDDGEGDACEPTDEQDDDGDGCCNFEDGCPDDPSKPVDKDACPMGTGLNEAPGQCGCGAPDDDADGDGTADCIDDCPEDPNKTAPGICGCGVADEGDEDGDGVLDCVDQCPGVDDAVFAPECEGAIPTVSEWGLLILALLLLVAGKVYFSRRTVTA